MTRSFTRALRPRSAGGLGDVVECANAPKLIRKIGLEGVVSEVRD